MRRVKMIAGVWVAFAVVAASAAPVFAQGPGGSPGMPMQRMGPARGQATGMGAPGMPVARMGRGGGVPAQATPSRRSYSGIAGVPGVMSSQNFRASNMAGQYKGGGVQRSSSAIISGATRGTVTLPANSR